ncbi:MAG: AAA family ATPase, partial [bacterium]|nr:AAA family ATPase [bacterium]
MKLCELQVKNYCGINEEGIKIKIDNIVVLIGSNNVGKSTVMQAYELFSQSGKEQPISNFHKNSESNHIEITGVFSELNQHDGEQIGTKWVYSDDEYGEVIKYKWVWEKAGVKGKKYSWNNEESKWEPGGMGGWDTKIASCIPTPLKINVLDDSSIMESKIVEILTSAVKESVKVGNNDLATMMTQLNKLAKDVKEQISATLDETTNKVQENLNNIFPNHTVDIQPQAGKFDVDKIIGAGTYVRIADARGEFYPLANQGNGLQRAFLWSALEALANTGNLKVGKRTVTDVEPRILLIEEPESFLHPPAIRAAREALYKIAELENWQVMITT